MKSKYGFEASEDRLKQLEGLLKHKARGSASAPATAPTAFMPKRQALPDHEQIYQALEQSATAIRKSVADILADFEQSKGHRPGRRSGLEFNPSTRLHYWRSDSIRGLYLQWSPEEGKPYLSLSLPSPLDNNDRKLGPVLERNTGVRVVVKEVERSREEELGDLPKPFVIPSSDDADASGDAPTSKYGFDAPGLPHARKMLRELFRREQVPPNQAQQTQRPSAPPSTGQSQSDARDEAIYAQLDSTASAINGTIQEILGDYERAVGENPGSASHSAFIRREYNRSTRLHAWRSESIKGLYLLWSLEESKPQLLLTLPAPLDRNARKLGPIIGEETKIRVMVQEIDPRRWSETTEPTEPFPRSKKISLLSRYGFETPEARRREVEELFRRSQPAPPVFPFVPQSPATTQAKEEALQVEATTEANRLRGEDNLKGELDRMAAEIDADVQSVLRDFEGAQGEQKPRVSKRLNEGTHLHYWTSNSTGGVYLQWALEESLPHLVVVLASSGDTNSRKLGRVLGQTTGLDVTTQQRDGKERFGESNSPTPASPGLVKGKG